MISSLPPPYTHSTINRVAATALVGIIMLQCLACIFSISEHRTVITTTLYFLPILVLISGIVLGSVAVVSWLCRFHEWFGVWVFIAVNTSLALLLFADHQVYLFQSIRLDDPLIVWMLRNPDMLKQADISLALWVSLLAVTLLVIGVQWGILTLARPWLRGSRPALAFLTLALVAIPASFAARNMIAASRAAPEMASQAQSFPFERTLGMFSVPQNNVTFHLTPAYPDSRLAGNPSVISQKKSVVVLVIDSFRSDMVNDELTPHLAAFRRAPGVLTSQHHYTTGHVSERGVFSLLYGVDSSNYDPFQQHDVQSYPLQILRNNGYSLFALTAECLIGWNKADFMTHQFDVYEEFKTKSAPENDEATIARVRQLITDQPAGKPFFLFVFLSSSHYPYEFPDSFLRYKPIIPQHFNFAKGKDALLQNTNEIRNRYKNSAVFMDHLFAKIHTFLNEKVGKENLCFVITSDHGEELFEHGALGHGQSVFFRERIDVPFMASLGLTESRNVAQSCHSDVFPTLFDTLGLNPEVPAKYYSSGQSLLREPAPPWVPIFAVGFPVDRKAFCIVDTGTKYMLWQSGRTDNMCDAFVMRVTDLDDRPLPQADTSHVVNLLHGNVRERVYRFLSRN